MPGNALVVAKAGAGELVAGVAGDATVVTTDVAEATPGPDTGEGVSGAGGIVVRCEVSGVSSVTGCSAPSLRQPMSPNASPAVRSRAG